MVIYMKKHLPLLLLAVILGFCSYTDGNAEESGHVQTFEYATIRWSGRDNTHIIRPSAKVEFIGNALAKVNKPARVDDRAFYMNIAMNGLAKEGYEFAGMSSDDIVMKRAVHQ
jgi:hypothetical protein